MDNPALSEAADGHSMDKEQVLPPPHSYQASYTDAKATLVKQLGKNSQYTTSGNFRISSVHVQYYGSLISKCPLFTIGGSKQQKRSKKNDTLRSPFGFTTAYTTSLRPPRAAAHYMVRAASKQLGQLPQIKARPIHSQSSLTDQGRSTSYMKHQLRPELLHECEYHNTQSRNDVVII